MELDVSKCCKPKEGKEPVEMEQREGVATHVSYPEKPTQLVAHMLCCPGDSKAHHSEASNKAREKSFFSLLPFYKVTLGSLKQR